MKKRFTPRFLWTLILMVVAVGVFAQGPPPPPPPPAPPPGVPIDGGIFLLLGAGLVYGARKLYKE
ncbi:MAG TPA: hypothetical protein VK174_01795 [Chitinophagales bacterium]|nr:hypothetical protein [Chitinophagales bacterium]HLP52489.1 hypothetical protein [Chitinophagales bacterium]